MKTSKILLTVLAIVTILTLLKLPYPNRLIGLFNNDKLIKSSYQVNECFDTEVVLFNLFDNNPDSLRSWIATLDKKNPRLLVFDYFLESNDSFPKIKLNTPFILPMTIEDDSTRFSKNPFEGEFSYGVTNFSDLERFNFWIKDENETYPSIVTAMAMELGMLGISKVDDALIKWCPHTTNLYIHDFTTYSTDLYKEDFTDKIVLLGYFGDDISWPEPLSGEWLDVHETPIGKVFGSIVILNAFETLRKGIPVEYSLLINSILSMLMGFAGFYLILRIRIRQWIIKILLTQVMVLIGLFLTLVSLYYLAVSGHFFNIELISTSILVCWETAMLVGIKTMSNCR